MPSAGQFTYDPNLEEILNNNPVLIGGYPCIDCDVHAMYRRQGPSQVTRRFITRWLNYPLIINACLPYALSSGVNSGGITSYPFPFGCPNDPSKLLAQITAKGFPPDGGISGKGFYNYFDAYGSETQMVGYPYAELEFIYESQKFQGYDSGEFSANSSRRTLQFPWSVPILSFMANDHTGAQAIDPQDLPGLELTTWMLYWTKRYQTTLPMTAMIAAGSSPVNSVATAFNWAGQSLTINAGLLKYIGSDTTYSQVGVGAPMWRIRHGFSFQCASGLGPLGWNQGFQPSISGGTLSVSIGTIYYMNSSNKLFATSDLNTLL